MEIQHSLQFPHAYEYKALDEIPSKVSNNFHIPPSPGSEKVGMGAGLMLKIIPDGGEPWLCTVDGMTGTPNLARQSLHNYQVN